MTKQNEQNITWFTVNNTVPIVVSAVMMAASFFALKSDVALQNQKLDRLAEDTKTIIVDNREDSTKLANHETRITVLENRKTSQVPKQSTIAQLLPSPLPGPTPQKVADQSAQINVTQTQSESEEKEESKPTPEPQPSPITELVNQVLEPIQGLLQ